MSDDRIVKLTSKDGETFEVPMSVAKMSALVSATIDDEEAEDEDDSETAVHEIPVPNVKSEVLRKVIDFCAHHQEDPMTAITTPLKSAKLEDLVQKWYVEFCDVEQVMLFELVTAANFMDIKPLLDLTCLAVSILIKGKQASELRAIFNITNELTPEEENQLHQENNWNEGPSSS